MLEPGSEPEPVTTCSLSCPLDYPVFPECYLLKKQNKQTKKLQPFSYLTNQSIPTLSCNNTSLGDQRGAWRPTIGFLDTALIKGLWMEGRVILLISSQHRGGRETCLGAVDPAKLPLQSWLYFKSNSKIQLSKLLIPSSEKPRTVCLRGQKCLPLATDEAFPALLA